MIAQLDHLIAVFVGAFLILALLVVQKRTTLTQAETTLSQVSRVQADAMVEVLAQDVENVLTPDLASGTGFPFEIRIDTASGQTSSLSLTTLVRTTVADSATGLAAFTPGRVRYDLTPSGRRIWTGLDSADVYRLDRSVDTGAGFDRSPLGEVVGFDVAALTPGGARRIGSLPAVPEQLALSLAVAADAPTTRGDGTRSARDRIVRAEASVRPANR
ncbi:MAG: hypothetical protein AAGK21_07255 [Bacteroidota bacterium]